MTDLYFDFLCPYAWRGVELAATLRAGGEGFRLRHYSLAEGNHPDNAQTLTWRLTDQSGAEGPAHQQGSLRAFVASHAAAGQGEAAHWAFALALFRAVHEDKQLLDTATLMATAETAGVDLAAFERALADDQARRAELRADLDAARELGVFGTPTFVLPTGEAAYYRFETLTRDPATAREWWTLYRTVLTSEAEIGTVKRAKNRPPRKGGVKP
ncbi:DsbA family oxidoreductase [Deinococcus arcticus]|uniref:Disulfide bond formation protein DsbA n=1 Tax=Deinococcus arcticus TaxID=2136176 RepID=A0A2T3WAH6_9DEIO|nr:DsbA family protein [Deinococcus arcticus]PTA68832.1 disulfide bond formation protein DsbA [Deinococcus arcticus]